MEYTLMPEQSSVNNQAKNSGSAVGMIDCRYLTSSGWNLKDDNNLITSSWPANIQYSPWKGFLRKNKSNTAGWSTFLFFQWAYVIDIWYISVSIGPTNEFVGVGCSDISNVCLWSNEMLIRTALHNTQEGQLYLVIFKLCQNLQNGVRREAGCEVLYCRQSHWVQTLDHLQTFTSEIR